MVRDSDAMDRKNIDIVRVKKNLRGADDGSQLGNECKGFPKITAEMTLTKSSRRRKMRRESVGDAS